MYKTEQEKFWAGNFGNEYIQRNMSPEHVAASMAMFAKILKQTKDVNSVLELGANIGINLKAINLLLPSVKRTAIEINKEAVKILEEQGNITIYNESILKHKAESKYDFVFTRGVMIHINPDELDTVYKLMYESSNKYICIAEYYNPRPVMIDYRGEKDRLFKRDFAGDMLDKYPDLELVDYGFVYHRDSNFPQDDINWFLLKK